MLKLFIFVRKQSGSEKSWKDYFLVGELMKNKIFSVLHGMKFGT